MRIRKKSKGFSFNEKMSLQNWWARFYNLPLSKLQLCRQLTHTRTHTHTHTRTHRIHVWILTRIYIHILRRQYTSTIHTQSESMRVNSHKRITQATYTNHVGSIHHIPPTSTHPPRKLNTQTFTWVLSHIPTNSHGNRRFLSDEFSKCIYVKKIKSPV